MAMASLQARHSRSCATGRPWTSFASTEGCTCRPTYYVIIRRGRSKHSERVGKDRQTAQRALRRIAVAEDEGRYVPLENIRFEAWAERWRQSLERKQTTIDSYRSTVAYATGAFGQIQVRRLRTSDLARLNDLLTQAGLSASTRAKHLRVVNACLASAVEHGYAAQVPRLPKAERPRPARREAAYFENDELPRLFGWLEPGVYRLLFEVSLKTGMRLGELLALAWGDVDLIERVVRVRRAYADGQLGTPKNHERRDVDLTSDLVEALGAWWGELGRPDEATLVFPGETPSGYLSATTVLRRELYPAMVTAEVPRVGPTGERRTFHSFRHTFAKRALENGRRITWLSRHLGHSTLKVTTDVYGHFERAERWREAELMEGVFGV
jgi:integrase